MATEPDKLAAEKLEAEKEVAKDTSVVLVAASAWPNEGYNSFILLLFFWLRGYPAPA